MGRIGRMLSGGGGGHHPLLRKMEVGSTLTGVILVAATLLFGFGVWVQGMPAGEDVHGRCGPGGGRHSRGAARHHDHCALAIGVQRMASGMPSSAACQRCETLGSVTVICSDKTGTLTRNERWRVQASGAGRPAVECEAWAMLRGPHRARRRTSRGRLSHRHRHRRHHRARGISAALAQAAALCNDAHAHT